MLSVTNSSDDRNYVPSVIMRTSSIAAFGQPTPADTVASPRSSPLYITMSAVRRPSLEGGDLRIGLPAAIQQQVRRTGDETNPPKPPK